MAKLKCLHDVLNSKLTQFSVVHEDLSIDESMVPHYGRYLCKQYICGKPIRFGYKLLVLASCTGFRYNIEINEGHTANSTDDPLGTRVVRHSLSVCQNPHSHQVFLIISSPVISS